MGLFGGKGGAVNPFEDQITYLKENFSDKSKVEARRKDGVVKTASVSKVLGGKLGKVSGLAGAIDVQTGEAVRLLDYWRKEAKADSKASMGVNYELMAASKRSNFDIVRAHDINRKYGHSVRLDKARIAVKAFIPELDLVTGEDKGQVDSQLVRIKLLDSRIGKDEIDCPDAGTLVKLAGSLVRAMREWGDLAHGKGRHRFEDSLPFVKTHEELMQGYWESWIQRSSILDESKRASLADTCCCYAMAKKNYTAFKEDLVKVQDKTLDALYKLLRACA